MSRVKRILILILVGALLLLLSTSIIGQDISARAIVLGVGIDWDEENQQYIATTEIVSPGGGSDQQVGTFSKIIEGKGVTVAYALNDIYAQTGRRTSLGQCQILLLGESLYKNTDLRQTLPYFIRSETFKDSASLCCTVGEANALMKTQLPFAGSISFTLVELLKDAGQLVAVPAITLNRFVQSQLILSRSGAINLIEYKKSSDQQQDQSNSHPQGTYKCGNVAVFRDNRYVTSLDENDSLAYTLIGTDCIGQLFPVTNQTDNPLEPPKICTVLTNKSIDLAVNDDNGQKQVTVVLKTKVHSLLNGYQGEEGIFHPKWTGNLTDDMLQQTKSQIISLLDGFFQKQNEYDFDIVNIHKVFEMKYGTQWGEQFGELPFEQFTVSYDIKVEET